jgi:protein-disulfide isomerase
VNPTIKQIKDTYKGDVQFSFVHNALPFHKDAHLAAMALVAAQNQGKFWEMHDKLFANQKALKRPELEKYGAELGLDMEKFKADLGNKEISAFVDQNRAMSNAVGATGTPAFFINGNALKGAQPFPKFKEVIDKEIAAADAAGKKGEAWLKERLKANNADLAKYYVDGVEPPKVAAPKPSSRPVDRTVYKVDVNNDTDPIKGNKDAAVTLAVFSEFQCPFCSRIKPTFDKVEETYGDKVRIVFKHNPLPFHKDAFKASEASMCAMEEGKFWEMHDKLFANMKALKVADLEKYAGELGLNPEKFKACLGSNKYKEKIEGDQDLASKVTARGTPNTFVNGRKLTGAKPFAEFKTVIDEEIKKAEARLAKGTSAKDLYAEIIKNGKVFQPLEDKVNAFDLGKGVIKGKKNAKIQIVEFSDFQCPFCSRVTAPLYAVKKHYGDQAVISFKNFPLSFHKQAMNAAEAFLCAGDQKKGWEMHDKMFAGQKELADDKYAVWAGELGLKVDPFKKCMDEDTHKALIQAEMAEGRKAGVRGTPSIYINGRKFSSPTGYNLKAFTSIIDKHILNVK